MCGAHVLRLFAALLSLAVRRTRIAHIAIIHSKTSFVGYCGRGAHVLRLFSISILRARRASPLQSLASARLRTRFYCHYRSATLKLEFGTVPTSYLLLPTSHLRPSARCAKEVLLQAQQIVQGRVHILSRQLRRQSVSVAQTCRSCLVCRPRICKGSGSRGAVVTTLPLSRT